MSRSLAGLAVLAIFSLTGFTEANPVCNRQRVIVQHHAVELVQPVVAVAATPYVATQVVPVAVSPDYYYSVAGYSRDRLLVDAIAGRVLDLHRQGMFANPQQPLAPAVDPMRQQKLPVMPSAESPVSQKLSAIVAARCSKCHSGANAKGGLSLDDLGSVPEGVRWKMFGLVHSGAMPQGGQPVADADVQPFYDFAAGKK